MQGDPAVSPTEETKMWIDGRPTEIGLYWIETPKHIKIVLVQEDIHLSAVPTLRMMAHSENYTGKQIIDYMKKHTVLVYKYMGTEDYTIVDEIIVLRHKKIAGPETPNEIR